MIVLPPLRKKIYRGFLAIVFIYGVVGGLFVLVSIFTATALTPQAIHRNYDTIEASRKMQKSWTGLHDPKAYPSQKPGELREEFKRALDFQFENITEPGEKELTDKIADTWSRFEKNPLEPSLQSEMNSTLESIISINESGLFDYVKKGSRIRRQVAFGVGIFFLIVLLGTLLIADSLANRISRPLKAIAELLKARPKPGQRLKLPEPTALELRVLNEELSALWDRVSESDRENIERIRRQSKELEIVLSSVEDAMMVVDAKNKVTHLNEQMAWLLRLNVKDALGKAFDDLPTLSQNYKRIREMFLSKSFDETPSFELIGLDDEPRHFAGRIREVKSKGGELLSTLVLFHDVTEIRKRNRLKSEFVDVISHELKTPIQSAGTALELLKKQEQSLDDSGRLLLKTLNEDLSRIRTVSSQLRQVGVLSDGGLKIAPQATELNDSIRAWLSPLQLIAGERKTTIRFHVEGSDHIYARIDPEKFPWVLSNLVTNAIRVSPEGGAIEVMLTDRNGYAELKIMDHGPGISEDMRSRIFEPYFRGKKGQNRETAGSAGFLGLGLTIAKEVTEALGGRLEYYENQPKGACFRVLLPIVDPREITKELKR